MTWLCNMFWDVYEKKSPVSSLDRLEFKEAVALIVIVNIVCYHEHLLNWINTVWERSGTWHNCSVLKIAKDEFIMWSLMRLTQITVWNFSMKFQQITALLRLRKSLGYICVSINIKLLIMPSSPPSVHLDNLIIVALAVTFWFKLCPLFHDFCEFLSCV